MSQASPAASRIPTGSLFQLGLSALGLGGGVLAAVGLVVLALYTAQSGGALRLNSDALFAWTWAIAFLSLPALPSLYYTLRRLLGKTVPAAAGKRSFALASGALLLFPLALAVGQAAGGHPILAQFVFPVAALLATALPIWWAVELARRGADAGSPQRQWGTLNFALYFSTPLVFIIETVGLILLVLAIALWIAGDGQISAAMQDLQRELFRAGGDLEAARSLFMPILKQPLVLIGLYAAVAVIVPLVEELFKPLALWFLLGRKPSPAAGLALGAVAGAGFALPETLFNLAGAAANPQWLALATGRVGTGFLHVCTAALTGMAIASAWRGGKTRQIVLVYVLSVALHGLWNALTITSGLAGFFLSGRAADLATAAAIAGLVLLALFYVDILYVLNRRLRAVPVSDNPPA
jgi:hypothetical protein